MKKKCYKKLKDYRKYCNPFYIKKVINGEEIDFRNHMMEGFLTTLIGVAFLNPGIPLK